MNLNQKIALARNQKGFTQEELAAKANVTVRTIQRIESGNSVPRSFTLRILASALDIPFEDLHNSEPIPVIQPEASTIINGAHDEDNTIHFLRLLCLSCFSYLLIPYVHFLFPMYLLKQRQEQNLKVLSFGRKVIRSQLYWVVLTTFLFLLTLAYNFINTAYFHKQYTASYLLVFFLSYFLNAAIIIKSFIGVKTAALQN